MVPKLLNCAIDYAPGGMTERLACFFYSLKPEYDVAPKGSIYIQINGNLELLKVGFINERTAEDVRGSFRLQTCRAMAPAVDQVIIDEPTGLHVCVYDCTSHKFEPSPGQIATE